MSASLALARGGPIVRGSASSWAVLSACGRYRYLLGRTWDAALPVVVWIMLNPSTADHAKLDPTIRKCIGFTRRWGGGGIVVGNLFAWRATDQAMLLAQKDPVGPWNDEAIALALCATTRRWPAVAGWGKIHKRWDTRAAEVIRMLHGAHCIGVNDNGSPRHPLMPSYKTPRVSLVGARKNLRAGLPRGLRHV